MNYKEMYKSKLTTAEEAVKVVKTGDWVDYGFCTNHAFALDQALAKRLTEDASLRDLKFRGGVAMWRPEVTKIPDAVGRLTWNPCHTTGVDRGLMESGLCYYLPIRYSETSRYYRDNIKHIDVLMMQVAPMDEHGYFNFGLNAAYLGAACEISDVIILEVNENMPVCHGGYEVAVHIDQVDMIVEGPNQPIASMPSASVSEKIISIAHPQFREELIAEAEKMHIWKNSNKR